VNDVADLIMALLGGVIAVASIELVCAVCRYIAERRDERGRK
jgi:hypothetical protein